MRYSRVLLDYAEVLNDVNNGPTPLAIELVNRVRERVNLPPLQDSKYYTDPGILTNHDKFLKHLQIEDALENCFELHRWYDLKRWGLLDSQQSVNKLMKRDPDFKNFVVGKSNRLPIPQTEVDNNPNLKQNPGY